MIGLFSKISRRWRFRPGAGAPTFLAILSLAAGSVAPGCVDAGRASSVKGATVKPLRGDSAARDAFLLVNDARRARGMAPLIRSSELDAVAARHARDQLRMNRLSHTGSGGGRLEDRLAGLDWVWAGENLARNKGFDSPQREAVRGWIASPRHYDNMFRPDFTHAGMASLFDPESGFTYFVQVFVIPAT